MNKDGFQTKAQMEAFDSFWEAPDDVEKGYKSFGTFYKYNYLKHFPKDKQSNILIISCGPGYMVHLLNRVGYSNVLGLDSIPEKVVPAKKHGLNCISANAFDFLAQHISSYDVIFCEQEINHLTKDEILLFLKSCNAALKPGGKIIFHSLNGANPIVGSENLALNFDHYNTLTEQSMVQVLNFTGYKNIRIFPLKLYVFFKNPFNYIGITVDFLLSLVFRLFFIFYGKNNKIFSKKIGASGQKP